MKFVCGDIVETTYLGEQVLYRLVGDSYMDVGVEVVHVVAVWSTHNARPIGHKFRALVHYMQEPRNQLLAIALAMKDPPAPFEKHEI